MKKRIFLASLLICALMLPMLSSASEWVIFTPKQKDGSSWYYDKASIEKTKYMAVIGIPTPFKDGNYLKMWVRNSTDSADKLYQVELSCKDRTARMQDNNGKSIYNMSSIDYLADRAIPPDTVLDWLRKSLCR